MCVCVHAHGHMCVLCVCMDACVVCACMHTYVCAPVRVHLYIVCEADIGTNKTVDVK